MDVGVDYFAPNSTAYCFLGTQNSVAYLDGKISGTSACFIVHDSIVLLCFGSLESCFNKVTDKILCVCVCIIIIFLTRIRVSRS